MNKEQICEAFCSDLVVTDVPAGLAVRTSFMASDGDAIGFYVTRHPSDQTKFRVEDSGMVIPMIEANGVNLDGGPRALAFHRLLEEYGASYDPEAMELYTEYVSESDLPAEAMRFVALLLRVQDLELLTQENVENTFKADVSEELRRVFDGKAALTFHAPPTLGLAEFEADVVINSENNPTLAVYVATTDQRVDEAVMLWMENRFKKAGVKVALVLEKEKPAQISNRSLRRAMNRLDATPVFRGGDVQAAMERIATTAGVSLETQH